MNPGSNNASPMHSNLNCRMLLTCSLIIASLLAPASVLAAKASAPGGEQVRKLTGILQSQASQKEKADACRELARIGNRDAVAALAALLPDESLTHMARYGLETIPDAEVDKVFRAAVQQLHGRPLAGVIGSIGVRRDTKAVKLLAAHLTDADPDVAQAAARALGKIGDSASAKALQRAFSGVPAGNQVAFCEGLFRCAERFEAAGKHKQAAAIYDLLRTSTAGHQVRTAALRGALLTAQKDAPKLLAESLASPEFPTFAAAARTSLEMRDPTITSVLVAQLAKGPSDKQILLTQTLGRRGDPAALPALQAAATTCETPVRIAAVKAISEFGNPSMIGFLVSLIGSPDREISQAALEAFASIPGKEADAAVMRMFADTDDARRNTAMDLMVRRRMTSAIPELFQAASGADAKLRVAAVRKLGELGDDRQIQGMLNLLSKSNGDELDATERALTSISLRASNRDAAAATLGSALAASQPPQKCAVLRVLGALGGSASLQPVRQAVNDASPEVRASAIRVLGTWNGTETVPDLLQLARSAEDPKDKVLSLRSYLGLAAQPEIPVDKRLAMCKDAAPLAETPDLKKQLLAALGTIPSAESFPLIVPQLADAATREEAGAACLAISTKLLEAKDASKDAGAVLDALRRVSEAAPDTDLARKAQSLAERAQAKSAAK